MGAEAEAAAAAAAAGCLELEMSWGRDRCRRAEEGEGIETWAGHGGARWSGCRL